MWLFCFFDLPVKTKAQRRAATRFRNYLLADGYNMLQYSVYVRIIREQEGADKHLARMARIMPSEGGVRSLQVTERQYARMKVLLGTRKSHEKPAGDQLLLL